MSKQTERKENNAQERLDDILNEYVAASPEPNAATLADWVRMYPEYRQQLTDFTVAWSQTEWLPPAGEVESVDEDTLVLRAMSVIQNIQQDQDMPQDDNSDDTEDPPDDLFGAGKRLGLSPQQLADKTKMNRALLGKLNRGLISPDSLPQAAFEILANTLQLTVAAIKRLLHKSPRFALGHHRATQAPEIKLEEFSEAVRNEPSLSEEYRAYWLDILSREANTGATETTKDKT